MALTARGTKSTRSCLLLLVGIKMARSGVWKSLGLWCRAWKTRGGRRSAPRAYRHDFWEIKKGQTTGLNESAGSVGVVGNGAKDKLEEKWRR
jgi:hypothetical protein